MAVNTIGEIFISDTANHRILKVLTNGTVEVIGGNGISGFSGDGELAINAKLNRPTKIVVDSAGRVVFCDNSNNRIRMISNNGTISTIAGSGTGFVLGDGGLATNAILNMPTGLTINSIGEILIADTSNFKIRKIDLNGIITTIAGSGNQGFEGDGGLATSAPLNFPADVSVHPTTNEVFIADSNNHCVRKILTNGTIFTVAGICGAQGQSSDGGLAINSRLNYPIGVAISSTGDIFIAERDNSKVRKVSSSTGIISTFAGNGVFGFMGDGKAAVNASIYNPYNVAFNSAGEAFISDYGSGKIRKVSLNGIITTVVGEYLQSQDGKLATDVVLNTPKGVAISPSGEVYFADSDKYAIRKITLSGTIITIAGSGLYGFAGDNGYSSQLSNSYDIFINSLGEAFIADTYNHRIRKIDVNGIIMTIAGIVTSGFSGDGGLATKAELFEPYGVVTSSSGDVFIADTSNCRIRKVSSSTGIITTVAGGTCGFGDNVLAVDAQLNTPYGISVNSKGELFIADTNNHRIRKVSSSGFISTIAGNGVGGFSGDGGLATNANLFKPSKVVVNSIGEIFIADSSTNRIRKILTNGTIITIAGNGNSGFNGDEADATNSQLGSPYGIALSSTGEIYISDQGNNRIRKLVPYCVNQGTLVNGSCFYTDYNNNSTKDNSNVSNNNQILAVVLPSVLVPVFCIVAGIVVVLLICCVIFSKRTRKEKSTEKVESVPRDLEMAIESQTLQTMESVKSEPTDFPSEQSLYFQSMVSSQYKSVASESSSNNAASKYNILEKIGSGAFGSVFRVEVKKTGDIKAVKALKYVDHDDLNNIMKEGIQLLKMDHPNIVKVNDMFVDSSQLVFIEMEFYAYGDLSTLIQDTNTIHSEILLRKILEQSCQALQYIHENLKIVHRDIKPSNIFLKSIDLANDDIHIVLADFGLAKDTQGSMAKSFAGTPLYMPLELSLGVNYTFNADVYSLGVTMYQLMTKDVQTSISYLYMNKNSIETKQILRSKMEAPNTYSDQLIDVVLNMIEKDMEKRPSEVDVLNQMK
ncbi:predicted protein [Naegleria gruberi]|uniref:Predicted protein n=1 Tax=Naegleria gruberi TaxID=5762 RepID=D2VK55_NAEGR|nr:uncharacterized protein NAEGRDRAFT_58454 [Naegleria gruberi]EFC42803.1 predicted protein [Naegleria gruberi]|eukprot:XP_002675547.1 predicted protein [Naegleria gruberi strain NEG-M]